MSEPIAVLALRLKRDQISGTIVHYARLLREAQHDLAHANAALLLFEAAGMAGSSFGRVLNTGEQPQAIETQVGLGAETCQTHIGPPSRLLIQPSWLAGFWRRAALTSQRMISPR